MIPSRFEPYVLSLMRIVFGFLLTFHGFQKLFGWYDGIVRHFPEIRWFAAYLETFGGTLLMVGLFTKPVAFILSGEMAIAYFIQHFPMGWWPVLNMGEPAVMNCFAFLYMAVRGGGAWALDVLRGRR